MKVLKAGIDFTRASNIDAEIGQKFLIKKSIATGWGKLAKVTRITKTQIELQIINVIPTEESNRFGVKNGLVDNRFIGGFFENWAFRKKCSVGKKLKFFKENCIQVGDSENWNPLILCKLTN